MTVENRVPENRVFLYFNHLKYKKNRVPEYIYYITVPHIEDPILCLWNLYIANFLTTYIKDV